MSAEVVVRSFVDLLAGCVAGLRRQFEGAWRALPGEPLMLFPRNGKTGRRVGQIEGVGHFALHGRGCHFELLTGEVIDFDWDKDGRETFNGRRLLQYARTAGAEDLSEAALIAAARRIDVLTEVRPGWFAVAHPTIEVEP